DVGGEEGWGACHGPIVAQSRSACSVGNAWKSSGHLGFRRGDRIDRGALADVVEMRIEEAARRTLALLVQPLEELEIDVELALAVEWHRERIHGNAMQPQP